jgi:hypothetical protein
VGLLARAHCYLNIVIFVTPEYSRRLLVLFPGTYGQLSRLSTLKLTFRFIAASLQSQFTKPKAPRFLVDNVRLVAHEFVVLRHLRAL